MSEPRRFVEYSVSDERRQAAWRSVRQRLARRRRVVPVVVVLAAAAMVALVGWRWAAAPAAGRQQGGQTVSTATTALEFTLDDGSRLELGAESSLMVKSEDDRLVSLELVRGSALFDVTRRPERTFRVAVEDVAVEVVGTRFRVERSSTLGVQVSVERGAVDVVRLGERRRLHPGESWSLRVASATVPSAPPPQADAVDAGVLAVATPPLKPRARPAAPAPERTADDVYAQLLASRRAQQWPAAADAARTFLDRFPADARCGLVSFELGRIEMDRLNAPARAAVRLRRAAALSPDAPFAEDALAREVRALEAARDDDACHRSRAAFLERFPSSVHRASVLAACPP